MNRFSVIGIGPVGLMSVAGTNLRGASRIIAVGTRPVCVEAAKKYGATDFIGLQERSDLPNRFWRSTDGEGLVAEVIIAGGGVETLLRGSRKALKPGGKIGDVCALPWPLGDAIRYSSV